MGRQATRITPPENFILATTKVRKRGKPSLLPDDELWHRRDRAAGHFLTYWSKYGWELRRVRNVARLSEIFADTEHSGGVSELFHHFRQASSADFSTLDENRSKHRAIEDRLRDSYKSMSEIRELWEAIKQALPSATGKQLKALQPAYERFRKEWENRRSEYEWLRNDEEHLRNVIELQEAAFAQSELLLFIQQKRYAFSAWNLANAVAGLPYMSYRQSVRRCKRKLPDTPTPLEYEIFKAIEYLCRNGLQELFAGDTAQLVMDLPSRYRFAAAEFKRNYYFLRKAIQHTSGCRRAAQVPFVMAEAYVRFTSSQSLLDRIRNYESQLK